MIPAWFTSRWITNLGAKLDYTAAAINAPTAWQSGWDGTGVGVAIIDSGITVTQDFNNKSAGPNRIVY
jgi:subtilisin family serine protease